MSARYATFVYCRARNKDGTLCRNKVPTFNNGVFVRGPNCHAHRKRKVEATENRLHS